MPSSNCPECGKATDDKFRPFCSKRCADVDLGRWFNEEYVVPGNSPLEGVDIGEGGPGRSDD